MSAAGFGFLLDVIPCCLFILAPTEPFGSHHLNTAVIENTAQNYHINSLAFHTLQYRIDTMRVHPPHLHVRRSRLETAMSHGAHRIPSEHLELWPYAKEQAERIPIVLERFNAWKVVLDVSNHWLWQCAATLKHSITQRQDLVHFFDAIHHLEASYAHQFAKLNKSLTTPHGAETHQVFSFTSDTMLPVQQTLQRMETEHINAHNFLKDTTIRQLHGLKTEIGRMLRHYRREMDALVSGITKSRKHAMAELAAHDRILKRSGTTADTTLSIDHAQSHSSRNQDPWLARRRLQSHLRHTIATENAFQNRVLDVHREIAAFDSRIFDGIKGVVEGYLSSMSTKAQVTQVQAGTIHNILSSVNSHAPFARFEETFQLLNHAAFTTPRSLESFPYSLNEIKIERQGILYRPGTVRKNKWRPTVVVLTETGWLHCFDAKLSRVTRRATQVGGVGVLGDANIEHILEGGVGTLMAAAQGLTGEGPHENVVPQAHALAGQVTNQPHHNPLPEANINLPEPFTPFSINLAHPRISITPNQQKVHQHVFSIIVDRRGATGGWFSGRGEHIYEFKASSEDEMIEWITILMRKIEYVKCWRAHVLPESLF